MSHPTTKLPSSPVAGNGGRRAFYVGAAIFVILLSVAGFGPSIIDPSNRAAPMTLLVIVHGVVAAAWILLFLLQAILVATGRTAVHRRVGLLGPFLAIGLIVVSSLTQIEFARRGYDLSGDVDRALGPSGAAPQSASELAPVRLAALGILVQFGMLAGAGLWYRHRAEVHKRLMLLALLSLTTVPFLHLAGVVAHFWPAIRGPATVVLAIAPSALLFTSAIVDALAQRRVHPVSWLVPVAALAWLVLVGGVVARSDWWRGVAAWLTR